MRREKTTFKLEVCFISERVESMILRKVLDLRKNIGEYRQELVKLAGKKDLTDPQVIKISQQLDGEIVMWQKIIQEIHPLTK